MQSDEFPGGPLDLFDDDDPASQALPYADIDDPQSLNKYAYTYNNPLRYVDPNGHDPGSALAEVEEVAIEIGKVVVKLAPAEGEAAEIGSICGPACVGVGVAGVVVVGVGVYEIDKHFSNPGPPPGPPTAKPPAATPPAMTPSPQMSKGGKQKKSDSGFINLSDDEVNAIAGNRKDPRWRRGVTEQKARRQRNKQKRDAGKKGRKKPPEKPKPPKRDCTGPDSGCPQPGTLKQA